MMILIGAATYWVYWLHVSRTAALAVSGSPTLSPAAGAVSPTADSCDAGLLWATSVLGAAIVVRWALSLLFAAFYQLKRSSMISKAKSVRSARSQAARARKRDRERPLHSEETDALVAPVMDAGPHGADGDFDDDGADDHDSHSAPLASRVDDDL